MAQQLPDRSVLEPQAKAGDPNAQFQMAVLLDREGAWDDALPWLERAAGQNQRQAQATLGKILLDRRREPVDPERGRAMLAEAARAGNGNALEAWMTAAGLGLGGPVDWPGVAEALAGLALKEVPTAQVEAGVLCVLAGENQTARALLMPQAVNGHPTARIALLAQALDGSAPLTRASVREWLAGLSQQGHPLAPTLAKRLEAAEWEVLATPDRQPDAQALTAMLEQADEVPLGEAMPLCERPRVLTRRRVLPLALCAHAIAASVSQLRPATIIDPATGRTRHDPYRTGQTATLPPLAMDPALICIDRRLARAADMAPEQGEYLSILAYRPGEEYKPHFDALPPDEAGEARLETAGQRVRTLLLSLTDVYEGGETVFPRAEPEELAWRGAIGDALIFHNALDDQAVDPAALHQGRPVHNGIKWLISKWFRERRFEL